MSRIVNKNFENVYELLDYCLTKMDGDEDFVVEIYGKSDFLGDLLTILISDYDFLPGYLDFATNEYDDYGDIYVLLLRENYVSIEPAKREKDGKWIPLNSCCDLAFLFTEDCGDDIISHVKHYSPRARVFSIGECSGDECADCGACCTEQPKVDEPQLAVNVDDIGTLLLIKALLE